MSIAKIPCASNVICRHGSDILLIKRSSRAKSWPNFWAFPGGKVDDLEFFREAWLRELFEETGLVGHNFSQELIVMTRANAGTKIYHFGVLDEWEGTPEIREKKLADDMAWFPISDLPELFVPHHRIALENILQWKNYTEIDFQE